VHFFVKCVRRLARAVLVKPRKAGIAHNGQEPDAGVAAAEALEEAERAQVGFLHHVLRVLIIPRQPARQVIGSIHVRQNHLLEAGEFLLLVQLLSDPPFLHKQE
jgi:hypothetical protein